MRRAATAVIACALASPAGAACGDALGEGRRIASSPGYEVAFRPVPARIEVARHFALDIVVCAKPGAAPPASVAVDATMPEHRHGMNYRPSLAAIAPGRWRAEGLLFHMPGSWELRFDVATAAGSERAALRWEVR